MPPSKRSAGSRRRRQTTTRVLIKDVPTTPYKQHSPKKQIGSAERKQKRTAPKRHKRQGRPLTAKRTKKSIPIPPVGDSLRIVPLGGVEEIGKNMMAIEYGDDIIIVDAGFQFSEAETPGIDFILPNVDYLAERKDKIRALFITHGHYDHIGAIPYVMEKIGNPPIYSKQFGSLIIQKRQTEFPDTPELKMNVVEGDESITAGKNFKVRFFSISHAIPDSMGLIIETPIGNVVVIEDVRVDHIDGIPTEEETKHYETFKNEKVLLFMMDSTSIEKPGFSTPESVAIATVEKIMKGVAGRLIIGTFASQVERVMKFIKMAARHNKMVAIDGRSMKTNVEIVRHLGLTDMKHIIPIEEINDHPPHKIVVIATGAQGEEYSVFDRIANNVHKHIKLNKTDTVLLSSSIIPGNELSITKLKDNLYRQEAKIITYLDSTIHASGHGNRGELEWIHKQIDYKYFMPVHGHHYMLRIHAELARSLGVKEENIMIPENGAIIELKDRGERITKLEARAPSDSVMVDGFSVGDKQELVLRDRQLLAEDGMFIIVASINPKTGKLRKSPDIISRGFVYLRESQVLLQETRAIIKRTVEKTTRGAYPVNFDQVKREVTDAVRRHLLQRTNKSPIVIPVIIGV